MQFELHHTAHSTATDRINMTYYVAGHMMYTLLP